MRPERKAQIIAEALTLRLAGARHSLNNILQHKEYLQTYPDLASELGAADQLLQRIREGRGLITDIQELIAEAQNPEQVPPPA